jgi:hypothetical protein
VAKVVIETQSGKQTVEVEIPDDAVFAAMVEALERLGIDIDQVLGIAVQE